MTKLKCPECGKEFDDTKQACPSCGCPVSLMATINSDRLSKYQNRMIALAIPIGIMSLVIALTDVFDLISHSALNISHPYNNVITICTNIMVIATFILLFMWFFSLSKGSAKNSKTKTISLIALIGISCFILYGLFILWVRLTLYISNRDYITLFNGWTIIEYFINSLKYLLFGGAFYALSGLFKGNMKVYALLTGILFLLAALVGFIPNGSGSLWLRESLSLLRYITIALFFFGFSKTYKS